MLSAIELLTRIHTTLGTPLLRNERRQTDRAWYGAMSLWISIVTGWLVTWGFALVALWLAGPYWWLAAAPVVFVLIQILGWGSAPDMVLLLQREQREHTLEALILTTADRQNLLWAKLVASLRANMVLSLSYLPLGLLAGALVWARSPEDAARAPWGYGLGGLALGVLACLASLGGALSAATVGARAALSRRGFIGQLGLALVTTLPLCLLDVFCLLLPMAAALAALRSSISVCPLTVAETQVLDNMLASVGLSQSVFHAVGLPAWLLCCAMLFALRLLVLNLWLPLWLMRYCAAHFDERLLRES